MIQIKAFTFNPIQENSYILYTEKGHAVIIDPGCYFSAEQEMLKDFLFEHALTPTLLLNTHCHLDHVFGNHWVHQEFGLELNLHPSEKPVLEMAPESGKRWGLPFQNYNGTLHFLQENDLIPIDDDLLKVIAAPGHSPGSICFYCEAQHFLISGDVLFYQSIGRTDLPGGDHLTLLNSIKSKLYVLPDNTTIYPGHGKPTSIGYEKLNNPFVALNN